MAKHSESEDDNLPDDDPTERWAEKVLNRLSWAKFRGQILPDFDPLVVVMHHVRVRIDGLEIELSADQKQIIWLKAIETLQMWGGTIEHNRMIPCRTCDQAFEPVVDDILYKQFLAWDTSRLPKDLIAIHKCAACGGSLKAIDTETYEGDWYTPAPGTIQSDDEWCETLLEHTRI